MLIVFVLVIVNCVCKDCVVFVECCCCDVVFNFGVVFEMVFGVFVLEMEGFVGIGGVEGVVDRVEGDVVDGVIFGDLVGGWVVVVFEGEVGVVDM